MKNKFKRIFSVLLAAVTVMSASLSIDFSVFATETDSDTSITVPVENTESATELTEPATEVTEPSTEPATEVTEPTTEATEHVPTKPAPAIAKVKNVEKTSALTNKITLTWDAVEGATGYFVYHCAADTSNTFKKVATVNKTTFTISNLAHTSQQHFKISAYVEQDGVIYEGKATLKKTATQPANISKLVLNKSDTKSIKISWTKNSKATGYKIYRACAATGGKFVAYKNIKNPNTTSLVDKGVKNKGAYYYRVRSYRTLPYSTYHSEIKSIKTVCGLHVGSFSMTSQLSKVSFSWKKVSAAKGYEIYYSTAKDGKYARLGYTSKDYYNTDKLTNGKTYYFRIRPYKLVGSNKAKVVGSFITKSIKVTNKAYGENIGNTYIEISLKQQHMWFYIGGKLYCETDVVTGNNDGYHNTPKGAYSIWQRAQNTVLVGANYASPVDYWLGFTYSGVGIHDASWRSNSEYGGTTYMGNGSHGCVNTPYKAVKKIYSKAKIGTRVVVY